MLFCIVYVDDCLRDANGPPDGSVRFSRDLLFKVKLQEKSGVRYFVLFKVLL